MILKLRVSCPCRVVSSCHITVPFAIELYPELRVAFAHIRCCLHFEIGRPHILYFGRREVVRYRPPGADSLACYPKESPFNVKNLPCLSFWLASVTTAVGGLLIVSLNDALLSRGLDSVSWETIVAPTRFVLTTDTRGTIHCT